ncbi:MAG: hypothetical protein CL995_03830, partial [Euryarchaeota archaeon]|nr:hypothetical protein [Euryarchaeota archaeon]
FSELRRNMPIIFEGELTSETDTSTETACPENASFPREISMVASEGILRDGSPWHDPPQE